MEESKELTLEELEKITGGIAQENMSNMEFFKMQKKRFHEYYGRSMTREEEQRLKYSIWGPE